MKNTLAIIAIVCIALFTACNDNSSSASGSAATTNADANGNAGNTQAPTDATDRGRVLYQEKCMACHGMTGDAQSNNAANLPHSILDSLSITETIKNGRGTMPMFKDAIADSDIAHLTVYVKGLRK
ncbi:MAG: hypothetical protein JWQ38_127 [Flavipsychrobacter sp.]|nr:hypothetical protein [Flavipsychrobacter sp.]